MLYALLQVSFYCRHIPLLYRPLFPILVYSRCSVTVQEIELWTQVGRRQLFALLWAIKGEEVVVHACKDAVHYLKSSVQSVKSHQAQLLGVPRKGDYELIPLGVISRWLWAVFFVLEASEKCHCDCEGEREPVLGWVSWKQVHSNLASSRNHSQHGKPCSPELLKSFAYLAVVKLVWRWNPE